VRSLLGDRTRAHRLSSLCLGLPLMWCLPGCQGRPEADASDVKAEETADASAVEPNTDDRTPATLLANISKFTAGVVIDPLAADQSLAAATLEELQQRAASNPDGSLLAEIGRRYQAGRGTPINCRQAAKWYQRAAEKQNTQAMVCLAELHRSGRGVRKDPLAVLAWLRMAAGADDVFALTRLGQLYVEGQVVPRNVETGVAWLAQAAAKGEPEAIDICADLCEQGAFGEPTPDTTSALRSKARTLMEQAARAGNVRAMIWMAGRMFREADQVIDAKQWLQQAAESGDTGAMVQLASLLSNRSPDSKEHLLAVEWCAKAAKVKDTSALLLLADFCERGVGGPVNLARARDLRRSAARGGDVLAMRIYAETLKRRAGNDLLLDEAFRWTNLAAGLGDGPSVATVGIALKERVRPSDIAAAVAYFSRGARWNDPESLFQLGLCRENGIGIERDLTVAMACYRKAAGHGHSRAMFRLAELLARGNGDGQELAAEAFRWYEHAALSGEAHAARRLSEMFAAGTTVERDDQLAAYWERKANLFAELQVE